MKLGSPVPKIGLLLGFACCLLATATSAANEQKVNDAIIEEQQRSVDTL